MRIGIPIESRPGERLVAATPKTVGQLVGLGYEVVVERGAGAAATSATRRTRRRAPRSGTRPTSG